METISINIDTQLLSLANKYAKENNVSLNEFIVDALKEKLEDIDDYETYVSLCKNLDTSEFIDFKDLCAENNIDYENL